FGDGFGRAHAVLGMFDLHANVQRFNFHPATDCPSTLSETQALRRTVATAPHRATKAVDKVVAQVSNRFPTCCIAVLPACSPLEYLQGADCKSAIRQVGNPRYVAIRRLCPPLETCTPSVLAPLCLKIPHFLDFISLTHHFHPLNCVFHSRTVLPASWKRFPAAGRQLNKKETK